MSSLPATTAGDREEVKDTSAQKTSGGEIAETAATSDAEEKAGEDAASSESEEDGESDVDADHGNLDDDEAEALKADLGDDLRQGKRIRRNADAKESDSTNDEQGSKAGPSNTSSDVWKEMQGESSVQAEAKQEEAMVRVVQTYRFAGEDVEKEMLLPASHPDAKAFLAKQQKGPKDGVSVKNGSGDAQAAPRPAPPAAKNGPRKRKLGSLAAMSAAASAAGKPAKLNTLEKSKMDWTKFKDSSLDEQARHEIDAQTRGGASGLGSMKGYMERKDFLDRVQNRLDGGGH